MSGTVHLRDLAPGDAGWVVMRHGELYPETDGFDASFEALVASIVAGFIESRAGPVDRAWIAVAPSGARLGCVFCKRVDARTAQLRLFLVEPAARGRGLGQLLYSALEAHARASGLARIVLWTHEAHRAACALYERNGFTCVSSEPAHSFGKDVVVRSYEKSIG